GQRRGRRRGLVLAGARRARTAAQRGARRQDHALRTAARRLAVLRRRRVPRLDAVARLARRHAGDAAPVRARRRRALRPRRRRRRDGAHAVGGPVLGRPLRHPPRSLWPPLVDRQPHRGPLPDGPARAGRTLEPGAGARMTRARTAVTILVAFVIANVFAAVIHGFIL